MATPISESNNPSGATSNASITNPASTSDAAAFEAAIDTKSSSSSSNTTSDSAKEASIKSILIMMQNQIKEAGDQQLEQLKKELDESESIGKK